MRYRSFFREKTSLAAGLLVGALALGTASVSSAQAQGGASEESELQCRFLRVRGRGDDGRLRFWRLSATEILDLELVIGLPFRLEGEHRVDVKLYTPDDHLYRSVTILVSEDASASAPARRKLVDVARPVDVTRAERPRLGGGSSVRASIPVAGTAIVSSSLYGRWTAVAYLDGSTESCTAPRRFLLRE